MVLMLGIEIDDGLGCMGIAATMCGADGVRVALLS